MVPLALCRPGDELHGALRRYKDAPALSARRHYASVLGRMLQGFLACHGTCLEAEMGGWELLAVVPSSGRSPVTASTPGPFETVLRQVPALARLPRLVLGRGPGRAGHLAPDPQAFRLAGAGGIASASASAPASGVSGRRVLLLDDTWVTGARARSAAAALERARATVVAVVVCGRSLDPVAAPRLARWWAEQSAAAPGRVGRCCLDGCGASLWPEAPDGRLCCNALAVT
jgi:hypothetical protein